jgi:hypothetical protein
MRWYAFCVLLLMLLPSSGGRSRRHRHQATMATPARLAAACTSLQAQDLPAAAQRLQRYLKGAPAKDEPASALLQAVRSDLRLAAAAQSGAWTEQDVQLQAHTLSEYEAAAAQAAAKRAGARSPGARDVELAALSRVASYAWAGRQLRRAITAGRRILQLAEVRTTAPCS